MLEARRGDPERREDGRSELGGCIKFQDLTLAFRLVESAQQLFALEHEQLEMIREGL